MSEQTPTEYETRSWRELEAGRLPLRAQERLAALQADRAFTSDLSAAEHLAVRAVGFEPVGQVMGASVFQIGYTGGWDCGLRGGRTGVGPFGGAAGGPGWAGGVRGASGMGGGFSGQGMGGVGYAGGYGGTVDTVAVAPWTQALQQAQGLALGRLEQETRALGGDGVVAVQFSENQLPGGAVEFLVIGTAVRGPGAHRSPQVFSSALSGQDLLRLMRSGWMPVHLLFGVACMIRHDDLATRWNQQSWSNVELDGYTRLVIDTRAQARRQLADAAAGAGAEAAVLQDTYERISEHECYLVQGGRDHVVRTTFVGTGLARLPDSGVRPDSRSGSLPILRLTDRTARPTRTERQVR